MSMKLVLIAFTLICYRIVLEMSKTLLEKLDGSSFYFTNPGSGVFDGTGVCLSIA